MALDLRQNFVFVQYLENKWTEFHQNLYMHSYWQDLRWECYTSFFTHLYQSYGPWFTPKFCFRSISWTNGQILTKLYKTIYTDKIYLGIVSCHFSHICTSVSDSFTILGLWVLGLAVSHINGSNFKLMPLFFMTNLQYHCILGLVEIKTLHPRDKIMSRRCR